MIKSKLAYLYAYNSHAINVPYATSLMNLTENLFVAYTPNTPNIESRKNNLYRLDLAKLTPHKQVTYEVLEKLTKDGFNLVIDNDVLSDLNAPYHIKMLDATEDFMLNTYPNIQFESNMYMYNNSAFNNYQVFKDFCQPILQCLIFIDNQTDYYAACLPINYRQPFHFKDEKQRDPSSDLPVLKTTTVNILKVVHSFALVPINSINVVYAENCRVSEHDDLQIITLSPLLNRIQNKVNQLLINKTDPIVIKADIMASDRSLQNILLNVNIVQNEHVNAFLKSELKAKLNKHGKIEFYFKNDEFNKYTSWRRHLIGFNEQDISDCRGINFKWPSKYINHVRPYAESKVFTDLVTDVIENIYAQVTDSLTPTPQVVEDGEIVNTHACQPLTNANGLQQMLTYLTIGDNQHYFYHDHKLIALTHSKSIDYPLLACKIDLND